jgi:hypothetical protein
MANIKPYYNKELAALQTHSKHRAGKVPKWANSPGEGDAHGSFHVKPLYVRSDWQLKACEVQNPSAPVSEKDPSFSREEGYQR